jgi:hypothetical protein
VAWTALPELSDRETGVPTTAVGVVVGGAGLSVLGGLGTVTVVVVVLGAAATEPFVR